MFRHCVWYLVNIKHPIYLSMASYTALLDTPNFLPHITIQSGLTKEKAVEVAKRFHKYEKPFFSPSGWPKISKTTFKNERLDFYAVEQPNRFESDNSRSIFLTFSLYGFKSSTNWILLPLSINASKRFTSASIISMQIAST